MIRKMHGRPMRDLQNPLKIMKVSGMQRAESRWFKRTAGRMAGFVYNGNIG